MIRIVLIFIIVFLIVRIFILAGLQSRIQGTPGQTEKDNGSSKKGVPKEVGEYIDYEDIGKKS